jgi:predicted AlkP superfamily pyrophosphatase or phosphodiesterase
MNPSRYSLPVLALGLLAAACGPSSQKDGEPGPVSLIVLVSVDQLPSYLFERYDSLYRGGLRRLLEDGRSYTDAVHDHAHTWTSSGHATLATGRVPARHGIVANRWLEQVEGEGKRVESVDDEGEAILGVPGKVGMSPRSLRATGLADWVVAANPEARAVVVSGKRTTSVLSAGQTAAADVYYFEDDVGRFVTSTYYRDSDPEWIERFNRETLPELLADSLWDCAVPEVWRGLARQDAVPYENRGRQTSFPHRFEDELDDDDEPAAFFDWWDHTPKLDRAILALAREAVTSLSLGRRGPVDYLAVGLSQLDRVGHDYGPLSLEQLDAVLHLDSELDSFLEFLDAEVGAGRYVVALTSDHGVVMVPEYRRELGEAGRFVTREEIRQARGAVGEAMARAEVPEQKKTAALKALRRYSFIADVMTVEELSTGQPSDSFVALFQRSQYPGRIPGPLAAYGLVVRMTEGSHPGPEVTTHGSPYLYDRQVPLIFMGSGIESGRVSAPVRTVDVAPTLAALAAVPFPDDLDGRALLPPN